MTNKYVEEIIKTYNKIADEYARKWLNYKDDSYLNLLKKFVKLLENKDRVLDAGCGPGRDVKLLYELGVREVYGIDLSEKMLEIAKKYEPRGIYPLMDIRNLRFNDGFFDGIICVGVLVHLNKEDFMVSLKELYRVLKANGVLLLSVKIGKEEVVLDKKYGYPRTFFIYSEDFVKSSLNKVGFKVIDLVHNISSDGEKWLNVFCKK